MARAQTVSLLSKTPNTYYMPERWRDMMGSIVPSYMPLVQYEQFPLNDRVIGAAFLGAQGADRLVNWTVPEELLACASANAWSPRTGPVSQKVETDTRPLSDADFAYLMKKHRARPAQTTVVLAQRSAELVIAANLDAFKEVYTCERRDGGVWEMRSPGGPAAVVIRYLADRHFLWLSHGWQGTSLDHFHVGDQHVMAFLNCGGGIIFEEPFFISRATGNKICAFRMY